MVGLLLIVPSVLDVLLFPYPLEFNSDALLVCFECAGTWGSCLFLLWFACKSPNKPQ